MAPSGLEVPFQHFSGAKWCKEEKNADDKRRSVSAQSFYSSTRQLSSQRGARSPVFTSCLPSRPVAVCSLLLFSSFS